MAGMQTSSAKGGRRPLDATINLVPFIDLLSCCIAFLLITAVWVNLSAMDVSQGGGQGDDPGAPQVQLTVYVRPLGHQLRVSTGETVDVPMLEGRPDFRRLAAVLAQAKRDHAGKRDVLLRAADGVPFDDMIHTIDVIKSADFPAVSVAGEGVGG